jgi:hypothetical protein
MCRMDRVVKVDNTAEEDGGMVGVVVLPPGHVCGASPSAAASKPEDDGWLVGFCTDENTMKSYFLVRFCSAPSARVMLCMHYIMNHAIVTSFLIMHASQ